MGVREKFQERSVKIVTWKEIREEFISVNSILGRLIDEINPGEEYKFVSVEYLYGDPVINKGMVYPDFDT